MSYRERSLAAVTAFTFALALALSACGGTLDETETDGTVGTIGINHVNVELSPLQEMFVQLVHEDQGTQFEGTVTLDGKIVKDIPCGTYTVTQAVDGFEPSIFDFEVTGDDGETVEIPLEDITEDPVDDPIDDPPVDDPPVEIDYSRLTGTYDCQNETSDSDNVFEASVTVDEDDRFKMHDLTNNQPVVAGEGAQLPVTWITINEDLAGFTIELASTVSCSRQ